MKSIIKETVRQILSEIATPVVWHFTTVEAAIDILENNEFILSCADADYKKQNKNLTGYGKGRPYYFSTTRSKSIYDGYSWTICHRDGVGGVRIQLNGSLLGTRLHSKAGNYHGKGNFDYGTASIKGYYTDVFVNNKASLKDIKTREVSSRDEKEDTFWSPTEDIPNAIKYIQRIDVMVYKYNDEVKKLEELCDELGIPCNLYDDENAFSVQSKKPFDEDVFFEKTLDQAVQKLESGSSPFYIFDEVMEYPNATIFGLQGRYNIYTYDGDFLNDYWTDDLSSVQNQLYNI